MTATLEYTGKPKNYPAPGTNGLLSIRRWPNPRVVVFGYEWEWHIIHEPTDSSLGYFPRKKDATRIARELFSKLPPEDWEQFDKEALAEQLMEAAGEWFKAEYAQVVKECGHW
jgi:hypothetical protein